MYTFVKKSAVELCLGFALISICTIIFFVSIKNNKYKDLYKLEHYKFEQAQRAIDSLEIEKTELLKRAALHANSADSALAIMQAKKTERLKLIQKYENINNTIDNWTSSQLDSFFAVN